MKTTTRCLLYLLISVMLLPADVGKAAPRQKRLADVQLATSYISLSDTAETSSAQDDVTIYATNKISTEVTAVDFGILPGALPQAGGVTLDSPDEMSGISAAAIEIPASESGVSADTQPSGAIPGSDLLLTAEDANPIETDVPADTIPQAGVVLIPHVFLPIVYGENNNIITQSGSSEQSDAAIEDTNLVQGAAVNGTVSVSSVRTTDGNSNTKTNFNGGERIKYDAFVANMSRTG